MIFNIYGLKFLSANHIALETKLIYGKGDIENTE